MWMILIKLAVTVILSALLAPRPQVQNAKPSSLSDFSFPTASDRPIQALVGTMKVRAPNMLWYGNLRVSPIVESIDGGWFSSDVNQTVAYKYIIDGQFGLAFGEIDEVSEIIIGEKTVWTRSATDTDVITFDKPFHHGPDKTSGGVSAQVTFYNGSATQEADATLKRNLGAANVPPYQGLAHAVFKDFYVGNSSSVQPVHFVIKRLPKSTDGTTDFVDVNGNANPAYFIYEILTNAKWGRGLDYTMIDLDSIEAAAQTCHTEGLGVSFYIDSPRTISELIEEVTRHINATVVEDVATGKYKIKMIRADFDVADLKVLNTSNVKAVQNFSRGAITKAPSAVNVQYIDRNAGYNARTVDVKNFGVRHTSISGNTINAEYMGFTDYSSARRAADREMRAATANLASCDILVSRFGWDINVGDPIVLTWAPLGIESVIFRVREVDLGTLTSGEIKLSVVQDVFSLPTNVYDEDDPYAYTTILPAPSQHVKIIDAPWIFANGRDTNLVMAKAGNKADIGYDILEKTADDTSYYNAGVAFGSTPVGQATDSISQFQTEITISADELGRLDKLSSATIDDIKSGINIALIEQGSAYTYYREWIAYEDVVEDVVTGNYTLTGVKRGLLDTVPKEHDISWGDINIWFPSYGAAVSQSSFVLNEMCDYKIITKSIEGQLSADDSLVDRYYFADLNAALLPVGNVVLNGSEQTIEWDRTIPVTVGCIARTETTFVQLNDDYSVNDETSTPYAKTMNASGYEILPRAMTLNTTTGMWEADFTAAELANADHIRIENMKDGIYSVQKYKIPLV